MKIKTPLPSQPILGLTGNQQSGCYIRLEPVGVEIKANVNVNVNVDRDGPILPMINDVLNQIDKARESRFKLGPEP